MNRYPSLKIAGLLALGIALGYWLNAGTLIFLAISIVSLFASVVFNSKSSGLFPLILGIISAGSFAYLSSTPPNPYRPIQCEAAGVVSESVKSFDSYASFSLKLKELNLPTGESIKTGKSIWMRLNFNAPSLKAGDLIAARGVLNQFEEKRNPGQFDLKSWRERNGFIGSFTVEEREDLIIERDGRLNVTPDLKSPTHFLYAVRTYIEGTIEQLYNSNAPLIKALILGFRRELDPGMVESFRKTGLSHLLALSGLHIGFVALLAYSLAAALRFRLSGRVIFSLMFILLFVMLVPPRASTIRAAIMAMVIFSGVIFKRWGPPVNTIAFAGLIILAFRPGDLFDAGFQLSFAAVSGIILASGEVQRIARRITPGEGGTYRLIKRFIITPFLISLAATLPTMPLTSYHFGLTSIGAPLFNLIAVPLLGYIFAGALISVMIAPLFFSLAGLFADGILPAIFLLNGVAELCSRFAPVWKHHFAPLTVVLILVTLICFLFTGAVTVKRTVFAALILSALLIWDGVRPLTGGLQVWFLDVGHGDSTVILFPQGYAVVVDGGPARLNKDYNPVIQTLKRFNRNKIDLLAATHPEADHIGGLIKVVEEYPVDCALISHCDLETKTYQRLMDISKSKGVEWIQAHRNQYIRGLPGEYFLQIYNPPRPGLKWTANDISIVLELNKFYSDSTKSELLLTGDIERRAETALLDLPEIETDLLKIPHHGSSTSSSEAFLEAVDPGIAVISKGNRWERMADVTIAKLKSRGVLIYQTRSQGALLFVPDKDSPREWKNVKWRRPAFHKWLLGTV